VFSKAARNYFKKGDKGNRILNSNPLAIPERVHGIFVAGKKA